MNEQVEVTKLIYQDRIKLCEEADRRIQYLINTCRDYSIKINKPVNTEIFQRNISSIESEKKKSHEMLFEAIEQDVRESESFVISQRETIDDIKLNIQKLEDYQHVV